MHVGGVVVDLPPILCLSFSTPVTRFFVHPKISEAFCYFILGQSLGNTASEQLDIALGFDVEVFFIFQDTLVGLFANSTWRNGIKIL